MSHGRTLWEEGHERGRNVVALGVALVLTLALADLALGERLGVVFAIGFTLMCIALALVVRPEDFFTVGVLPPLLMLEVFVLLGITSPSAIADDRDGAVQAVISGLATHSATLVTGYGLCLGVLAVRQRVLTRRSGQRRPRRSAPPQARFPTSR